MRNDLEPWRRVWRAGAARVLTRGQLEALAAALEADDPRLLQGATCDPPPLACLSNWPIQAACPFAWCAWHARGGVGSPMSTSFLEGEFGALCGKIDDALGDGPGGCRYLLHFWDDSPRDVARRELLGEVRLALAAREGGDAPCGPSPSA